MPDYETLAWDLSDGVATITLNRPEAANALTMKMGEELMDASIRCDDDPEIRCVVLTGAGRMFCAGADLKAMPHAGPAMATEIKLLTTYLHAAISRFARMDAPLICAINGTAAGAGFSLALIGDLAIAAESARFTMAYSRIALTPDGSSTYFLPRMIGLRRSLELSMTNRMLSAAEALDWGMLNRVVPNAELQAPRPSWPRSSRPVRQRRSAPPSGSTTSRSTTRWSRRWSRRRAPSPTLRVAPRPSRASPRSSKSATPSFTS